MGFENENVSVTLSVFTISFHLALLIDLKKLSFSDPSWFGSRKGYPCCLVLLSSPLFKCVEIC